MTFIWESKNIRFNEKRISMKAHVFTPEEANKKLGEVKALVGRVVELKKIVNRGLESEVTEKKNEVIDELSTIVSKLEEMGIELKDMDTGLIDFPALRYGEPVYLCWRLGDEEVLYWHTLTDGFRGRKPLKPEMAQIR